MTSWAPDPPWRERAGLVAAAIAAAEAEAGVEAAMGEMADLGLPVPEGTRDLEAWARRAAAVRRASPAVEAALDRLLAAVGRWRVDADAVRGMKEE
jgi:hypothetical protein